MVLAVTRILGELAVRGGQPALVGELLGGVVLGLVLQYTPAGLPHVEDLGSNGVFTAIADLGVFFLMLLAGIEMRPRELTRRSSRSIPVAVGGMLVPLVLGIGLGWMVIPESDYRFAQVLFLGTALAITAVPVAMKILLDLDRLDSRACKTIVTAALVERVMGEEFEFSLPWSSPWPSRSWRSRWEYTSSSGPSWPGSSSTTSTRPGRSSNRCGGRSGH